MLGRALADGHAGLWASADVARECGPEQDFSNLVEYERGLEVFLNAEPALGAICQCSADALPEEVVPKVMHRALFVNETLTRINPQYVPAKIERAN